MRKILGIIRGGDGQARGRALRLGALALGTALTLRAWGAAPATQTAGTSATQPAARAATAPAPLPYKDISLPFETRVADLVSRMTPQEKAEQLEGSVPRNTRLGIPAMNWWTEGIHGISRAGTATVFPQAIGMAASWDTDLMHDVGDVIATEARAKYEAGAQYRGITIWAPTINMARDPRWGRTEETYGEDPYLTGKLGVAFVRGIQGDDPKYLKAVATPKHFALHSQETGRHDTSFDVPDDVLHDYYLPAFEACVKQGKAASIMAAFSGLDGVPDTANSWLLTDLLRTDWGFQGAVVTDRSAVQYVMTSHGYVSSLEAAVTESISAGVDVMSNARPLTENVMRAVQTKMLKQEVVDRAVSRNLLLRFRLGMFDPPEKVPFAKTPATEAGSPAHVKLALKAAEESFVLLKNDPAPKGYGFEKLLPLDLRRIDSIAVLGPYANIQQYGAYSGTPRGASLTPLGAIRAAVGDRVEVKTANWNDANSVVATAETSDVVILVMGLNSSIENEGIDRSTLNLPVDQERTLERVALANPLTVVVYEGGSPIGMDFVKQHVPAVLMIWYPGEQGGVALAETLLGKVNPSGKLPMTFYHSVADLPPLNDYDITKGRTYWYLEKPADFVFGHGLSYTTFAYRRGAVDQRKIGRDGTVTVTVEVANTGKFDGDEVAQLYVHKMELKQPPGKATGTTAASEIGKRPIKQLKGFQRVHVAKGQSREVTFRLLASALGFWDESKNQFVVEPGTYEILVGSSSADIRWRGQVAIE